MTATALVVSGIIFGFFATGSPALERQRGLDNQREKDLADLARCIENYSREYDKLPTSLSDLEKINNYSYCSSKKDPVSGLAYEYNIVSVPSSVGPRKELEFELCATFNLKSEESINTSRRYGDKNKWRKHDAGHFCKKSTVIIMPKKNKLY